MSSSCAGETITSLKTPPLSDDHLTVSTILRIAIAVACLMPALSALEASAQAAEPRPRLGGWVDGVEVEYYDFGSNSTLATDQSVATAPVWPLIRGFDGEGGPQFIDGQHNIFDTVPGDPDYTDLWAVTFVTVPGDYEPEAIRSLFEIEASGFPITSSGMLRNCPFVPEGTTLAGGEELRQGWVDSQPVFYYDFGPSSPVIAPVWIFVHGFDADGAPKIVEGQQPVFDSSPADADYTAFRRVSYVRVPEDYGADSIRSGEEVLGSRFPVFETEFVVNYPIVDDGGGTGEAATPPASYTGADDAGGSKRLLAVVGIVIGAGIVATVGAFSRARRKA